MRKTIIAILIAVLNGLLFLTSCDKKNDEPNDKDAVARITVVDEKGVPQGGLPFGRVYYYALPMIVMGILLVMVCISHMIRIYMDNEKAREGGDII